MSTPDDRSYFLKRADESRRQAEVAADSSIRSIHKDMATRYDRAARGADALTH